jgi:hypothetical protein
VKAFIKVIKAPLNLPVQIISGYRWGNKKSSGGIFNSIQCCGKIQKRSLLSRLRGPRYIGFEAKWLQRFHL